MRGPALRFVCPFTFPCLLRMLIILNFESLVKSLSIGCADYRIGGFCLLGRSQLVVALAISTPTKD